MKNRYRDYVKATIKRLEDKLLTIPDKTSLIYISTVREIGYQQSNLKMKKSERNMCGEVISRVPVGVGAGAFIHRASYKDY
jgi:hypothetical protein